MASLTDLGYPLGPVGEHEIRHPEWPSLVIRGVVLPVQVDGQVALTTVKSAGPLPHQVSAELGKMAGLVQVNVVLDANEAGSEDA